MSTKTVFISYRRDAVGRSFARSIEGALTSRGFDVFLDVDSIDAGDWETQLLTEIPRRAHFLFLLTPGALDHCVNQDDWLRREFERATITRRNIVPVTEESVTVADMKANCPESISAVFGYQVAALRHRSFKQDVTTLVERFIAPSKAPDAAEQPADSPAQFVTDASDNDALAKAVFGSFSYATRFRDSSSKDRYFPRRIDAMLNERLTRGDWALVEGHPLAGKTRAVFEAIKRLRETAQRVAVWQFRAPRDMRQKLVPPTFPDADYRIVWMDDIDVQFRSLIQEGRGLAEISRFLELVADDGAILLATARTGPAYYDFRYRFGLESRLWDKLEAFPINRLAGEEARQFTKWYGTHVGEHLPTTFDHQPGSVFLNLEEMGSRWRNMSTIAREFHPEVNVERAKDIMRALHVFYLLDAYRPGALFQERGLRLYLQRKTIRRREAGALGRAMARANLLDESFDDEEWDTLVEFLTQDKFHLGFLQRAGEYLNTETAYLDYVVGPDGDRNILRTVLEAFPEEEDRRQLGLVVTAHNFAEIFRANPPRNERELDKMAGRLRPLGLARDVRVWNQLIHLCPTLTLAKTCVAMLKRAGVGADGMTYRVLFNKAAGDAEARAILREMRDAGDRPDLTAYNALAARIRAYENLVDLVAEMKADGIRPDLQTYNLLVLKAPSEETVRAAIAEIKSAGLRPSVSTYNKLIARAQGEAEIRAAVSEMRATGIDPNLHTYRLLIAKAPDLAAARAVVKEMKSARQHLDVGTYLKLLAKASTVVDAISVIADMRAYGVQPGPNAFNMALNLAGNAADARSVIETMWSTGGQPGPREYRVVLEKTDSEADARVVLAEMQAARVPPDTDIYNAIMEKAPSEAAARAVFDEMRAAHIQPNLGTFGVLIGKTRHASAARAIIAEMKSAGVPADVGIYRALILRTPRHDAPEILGEMKAAGVRPNTTVFNLLIARTADAAALTTVLAEMKVAECPPDAVTFNARILKAADEIAGRTVMAEMKAAGFKPDATTFHMLILKAPDESAGRAIIEEMRAAYIQPDSRPYNVLVSKAATAVAARAIVAEMKSAGFPPDRGTYHTLAYRATDEQAARAVISEMRKTGIEPTIQTYLILIQKAADKAAVFDEVEKTGMLPHGTTLDELLERAHDEMTVRLLAEVREPGETVAGEQCAL